jgi:hypothetical protein
MDQITNSYYFPLGRAILFCCVCEFKTIESGRNRWQVGGGNEGRLLCTLTSTCQYHPQPSSLQLKSLQLSLELMFLYNVSSNLLSTCSQTYINPVGYSTIALNHVLQSKFDPKIHTSNRLDELLSKLKGRENIILLKRLTIILDESSEKGFGLVSHPFSSFFSS